MGKPKIRFEGYSEDWEQRKLGDITVKIGSGKTPSGGKSAYVETGIPLIRSQNVNGDKVDFADIVFVDETTDESMANSRVYTNDVLLNITGASIGRSAVYKGLESANVNQHVCIIRPTEGYQPDFIQLNLSSDNGQKQIDASQAGGGREGLNFQEIGKMQFCFPSLNEQKCIGRYFNSLDHFITLHQRKCDETKTLKKYMLQKMFPQNGEKVPEIRFDGFTEDWEQRKFGDYNDLMTGYPFESDKFSEDGIKLVRGMNVKRGYLDFSGDICVKWNSCVGLEKFLLKDGDILIQMDGALIGKSYAKIKENQLPALLVQRVTRARTNNKFASQDFMYQTIQRDFLRYIEMNKTETAVPHLSLNDIRNFEIMVPCLAEQKKIGEYFDSLDNLITLHQRKCNELKEIKKYMLQNMFV